MKFKILFFFLIGTISITIAQHNNPQYGIIDIEHYKLALNVNDSTNVIDASMEIQLQYKKATNKLVLDLVEKDSVSGEGMKVQLIFQNNIEVNFTHTNNQLLIEPKHNFPNLTYTYTIKYNGIPKDGLVISKNLHGDRTFFGDNWPNRAHNWFPCIDHPSEKATIEYLVNVPNYYQVVANGSLIEETNISEDITQYHYKTKVPLPPKVMVVGIAKFAVQNIGETNNVPVSTWVYPETKTEGFHDFSVAQKVLSFFITKMESYPFEKLANVQSKTRFGGMENAGNIFYFEKSVTGKQEHEDLIAHEIAHQWFGNSASEIEWSHLWLSEGFATYLTDLYLLETQGEAIFNKRLAEEKTKVLNFYKQYPKPVVDGTQTNFMKLLNPNSYQKGAWVLHMLRNKIGDEVFWKGIKAYYEKYKFSNASTTDFKKVMQEVSGKNLELFFKQWLFRAGHPIIKTSHVFFNKKLRLTVEQLQEKAFEFPLEIELVYNDKTSEIKLIEVSNKAYQYEIETEKEVKSINLDPNLKLLFEEAQ
ncbi:M1 family metallopeptidase [Lutibacter sp. TH_r2]|uniref:M1 family metallopeptidase n=1 Tax=Lutibacter sp. TH_r2 TaxID=3082083 RepID=UPI002952A081|nr:M1 family metallopeptidase [Lutibacter sp. TH_r2]MDV7187869.1 M1 family metallopeptidase [Lutibacter sp. TH_r2]